MVIRSLLSKEKGELEMTDHNTAAADCKCGCRTEAGCRCNPCTCKNCSC
jgi:hypothetical protein